MHNADTIAWVAMVHALAASRADHGKLVVAAFAEDPRTGHRLPQGIEHFAVGDVNGMSAAIARLGAQQHYNAYVPLATFRPTLAPGKKGTEAQIDRVLGLVADFDDADARNYATRLPLPPDVVLETSSGRFQAFYLLSEPTESQAVKATAERLAGFAGCDYGTKDLCHVWRVPGTLNWPNKKKVNQGRPLEPQRVAFAGPWNGRSRTPITSLCDALDVPLATPPVAPASVPRLAADNDAAPLHRRLLRLPQHTIAAITSPTPRGQRSDAAFNVILTLAEDSWSAEDIERLFNAYPDGIGERYVRDGKDLRADIMRVLAKPGTGNELAAQPLDIFGDTDLTGEAELPSELLPPVIETFARDQAARLGVDPGMIALSCLVTAAAAIHDGFKVQPKQFDTTWCESARLWGAVVAEPGVGKSPAISSATKPLKLVEADWAGRDAPAAEQYAMEKKIHDKKVEKYVREAAKGNLGVPPIPPVQPPSRRKIVNDVTVEALSVVLGENHGGVLVLTDELVGFLGSHDAYKERGGGKDRADWLEAFNGGPRLIDRVKRGRVRVDNWSACLLGGIQPGPARRVLGRAHDDGLCQRLLVVFGRREGDGEDRMPDHEAISRYTRTIEQLAALTSSPTDAPFTLSNHAHQHRQTILRLAEQVAVLPSSSSSLRAHLAKWPMIFARLLLTFHMTDAVSRGAAPELQIDGEMARRVAVLMADYLLPHQVRFYTEILGDQGETQHARWIAGFILARGSRTIGKREIQRAYHAVRHDDRALAASLRTLETAGWIDPEYGKDGKRPTRWHVTPAVHTQFAARAAAERDRREREKQKIQAAAKAVGSRHTEAA